MNYKTYQWYDYISLAIKQINKPCVYISNDLDYQNEHAEIWEFVIDQVKQMFPDTWHRILSDIIFSPLIQFDTEEEAWKFYKIFDVRGKTYASAIYASVYNADGESICENT